jgi:4-amino-4-deoxy-L-arabinose transferase-like glycosyltransferase
VRPVTVALLAALLLVGLWNARTFSPLNGYDAAQHIEYADDLVLHGRLPSEKGASERYSPPGFYAVAGSLDWLGGELGLGEPHRLVLAFDVLVRLATALLLLDVARRLWPGRHVLHVAALGFVVFLPVTTKLGAMFHPETLDLFFVTAALALAVRRVNPVALGAVLGLALLVRQFAAYGVAAVGLWLLAERRFRALAVAAAVAAVIALPWYVRQAVEYSNPVFAENSPAAAKPLWERRPAAFYVDPGLPDVFGSPWRPHFLNRAIPTTYSELWGDYFGVWAWDGKGEPAAKGQLRLQSWVGLLPTLLAVGGLVALLRRRLWLVALVPVLGLLGYGFFTVAYPTADGDVLKSSYMLTTATAWALCFGYAVDALARRRRLALALAVVLGVSALAELPFLLY